MAQYTLISEKLDESAPGREDEESAFSGDEHLLEKSTLPQIQRPFCRQYLRSIVFHSLCFSLNLVILVSILRWARKNCPFGVHGPDLVYSEHYHQPSDSIQLMTILRSTSTRSYRLSEATVGFDNNFQQRWIGQPRPPPQMLRTSLCRVGSGLDRAHSM